MSKGDMLTHWLLIVGSIGAVLVVFEGCIRQYQLSRSHFRVLIIHHLLVGHPPQS